MFSVHRTDMRLLAVTHKMAPLILEAAATPSSSNNATTMDTAKSVATDHSASNALNHIEHRDQDDKRSNKHQSKLAKVKLKKVEKAVKHKNKGNQLFKAGRHSEAIGEYTKALQLDADNHVYFSNRAIACLKVFR